VCDYLRVVDDLSWAHTRAEWEQAWNQVRHLETMRGQWLAFFFTALLGVVAGAGPRLDANSSRSLVLIAALALALETLSAAIFLAVARLNKVHHYYDQIILAIRNATITSPPAAVDLSDYVQAPAPPFGGIARVLASTKGVSQFVLLFGVAIFAATLAGDVIRVATISSISTPATVLIAVAFTAGLAIAGFCAAVQRAG
jgi:hypothetical protein